MNCPNGHGQMVEKRVSLCFCDRPVPAKIANIPAFVCPVCDERFHKFSVARVVERLKQRLDVPDSPQTMNVIYYREESVFDQQTGTYTTLRPFEESTKTRLVPVA